MRNTPDGAGRGRLGQSKITILLAVAGLLSLVPAHPMARTLVVAKSEPRDFSSVAAAVLTAASGDTVLVQPGTYDEWEPRGSTRYAAREGVSLSLVGATGSSKDVLIRGLCVYLLHCEAATVRAMSFDGGDCALLLSARSGEVRGCRFSGIGTSIGGAVSVQGGTTTIENCVFQGNGNIGGIWDGGALYSSAVTIARDCVFIGNLGRYGGAVYTDDDGGTVLQNCVFLKNRAEIEGGAVFMWKGGRIENCTFFDNAMSGGGAIACATEGTEVRNCIVAGTRGGTAVSCGLTLSPKCCDFWGNEGGDLGGWCTGLPGDGVFSEDPLFCNPSINDVGLTVGSPCLPGGTGGPDCGLIGAFGQQCGLIPVVRMTWGAVKNRYR
ncbi:MAG: right-handed parallel beta-helix repeat-containing protein [Candidatus Eisenbacteria bacterium]